MGWFGSDAPVPGDAATMVETGTHLTKLYGAFERAGNGFKAINTGGWYGDAADGFHHYLDIAAPKWFRAADSFESAGKAVADYAATLEAAQRTAKQAKADLEAAQQRSEAAREQHNAAVERANDSGGPPPPPFSDPAADDIAAAKDTIARAKADVQAAGDRAARVVLAAAKEAPAEPGMMTQLKETVVDGTQMVGHLYGEIGKGVVTGLDSMLQGVRTVMPFDFYNMTHPAGYMENVGGLAQGVAHSVTHPASAFKTAVNWNMWANNPGKALGTLIPSVVGTVFGVGAAGKAAGVASKLSKVSKTAGKIAEKVPGTGKVDAPSGHRPPAPAGRPDAPTGHQPAGHPGGQHPGSGPPGSTGHAPPPGQPGPGTPWGNSDMPPAPSQAPDAGIPDYSRPDGGFGPQGSSQPDVVEPPQNYSDGGQRRMPWEDANFDDGGPEIPQRNPADEQQPWRPSEDPPPSANGERDMAQAPSDRDPAGPEARPEHPDGAAGRAEPAEHSQGSREDTHASEEDHQKYRERLDQRLQGTYEENLAQLRADYPQLDHMPDEEAMGVRRYVGEDANMINRAMREGDAIDQQYLEPEVNNMRAGFDQLPNVSPDVPVAYRDIGVPKEDLPALLERYQPGEVVEERAFTSASKETPPEYFSGAADEARVRFIIEEPHHAKDLEFMNPDEREIVWNDGNRFGVERLKLVETPDGDEWRIYMTDQGR